MTYEDWLASVPTEITNDPLWNMKVYRLAVFAGDLAWRDVSRLVKDKRTIGLSDQLYTTRPCHRHAIRNTQYVSRDVLPPSSSTTPQPTQP
jgi:hypothetical protein